MIQSISWLVAIVFSISNSFAATDIFDDSAELAKEQTTLGMDPTLAHSPGQCKCDARNFSVRSSNGCRRTTK